MIPKVSWGIDIGKSSLKAVKMQRHKETIEIQAVVHIPYQNMTEGVASPDEVNRALTELSRRYKIKAIDQVLISLPGQSCLIRPVRFPPVSDLDQMIKVEAGNHIPFDLEQVEWRYLKVDREYAPGEEIEIMLFAVKKEDVTAAKYDLRRAGIKCDGITIAPMALFNLVKFEMDVPDNCVVLDIGADHSDLVVMEGNRFFVRELPFSGNDFTREIAKKYKTSFEEAEKVKRSNLTGQQAQNLFAVIQPALRDFVSEVHRSLMRTQSTFERLVLLGDASRLAGIGKFLAQQLNFKMQRFRDIMRMELDREVDIDVLQQHLPSFSVAMGLALQGLGVAKNELNFLPAEEQGAAERIRKQYFILVGCAVFYVLLIFMWMRQGGVNSDLEDLRASYSKNLDEYSRRGDKKLEKSDFNTLEEDCNKLANLVGYRNSDIKILDTVVRLFAQKNDSLPNLLVKPKEKPLSKLRRIDVSEEMLKENMNQKIWLLEYESKVVMEKEKGEEENKEAPLKRFRRITIKVAALVDDNERETQKRVIKEIEEPLKKALGVERLLVRHEGGLLQAPWLHSEAYEGRFRVNKGVEPEADSYKYNLYTLVYREELK
jgi:type IV pilus assembly protein PilM